MLRNILYASLSALLCVGTVVVFVSSPASVPHPNWRIRYFRSICLNLFMWSFFNIFIYIIPDRNVAFSIGHFRFIGLVFLPANTLLHLVSQTNKHPPTSLVKTAFLIIPTFCAVMVLLNPWTRFFISDIRFPGPDPNRMYFSQYNWAFFLHSASSYICGIAAIVVLIRTLVLLPRQVRKSSYWSLLGLMITVVSNVIIVSNIVLFYFDITIIGSFMTLLCLHISLRVNSTTNIIITSQTYIIGNLTASILVLDADQRILTTNRTQAESRPHGMPEPTFMMLYGDFCDKWIRVGDGRISRLDSSIITFAREGTETHFRILMRTVTEETRITGYIVEISEVTDVYKLFRFLEEAAWYDQLTGLYNRNAYTHHVKEMLRPESMPLGVVLSDVNDLKIVNDTVGHLAGDSLLQCIARIIKDNAPVDSHISRIGGDEFVTLMPNCNAQRITAYIAAVQSACAALSDPIFGTPSVSMGYSLMEDAFANYDAAVHEADVSMYAAKRIHKEGSRSRGAFHHLPPPK